MKYLLTILLLLTAYNGWAELENDKIIKFSEVKWYRIKITKEATLDDIKWLFNEAIRMETYNKELFKGKEKVFKLE